MYIGKLKKRQFWDLAYDHGSEMSKNYGVRGVPMYFLLNTEHTVVSVEYEITDQMIEAIPELLND